MKILIVEDNAKMRDMIRTVMSKSKNVFLECSDGGEAVKAYEEFHPDYVFMDVEMKPIDGITATKQIKHSHPDAKIIIVTNYGDTRTRNAARVAGADGFVMKENLLDVRKLVEEMK